MQLELIKKTEKQKDIEALYRAIGSLQLEIAGNKYFTEKNSEAISRLEAMALKLTNEELKAKTAKLLQAKYDDTPF